MPRFTGTIAIAAFGFVSAFAVSAAAQDMFTLPPEPQAPPEAPPAPEKKAARIEDPSDGEDRGGLPLRGPDTAWLIEPSIGGSVYSIEQDNGASVSGRSLGGSVGLTRYLPAVVDDAAPISLQPFLQRAGNFNISVNGGGFITDQNPVSRTSENIGGGAGAFLYLTRFLIFQGSFSYGYSTVKDAHVDQATHGIGGNAGFGLRLGDVQVVATYGVDGNDVNGTFQPQRWGPISLSTFMVFARELTVSASGFAEQGEGGGGAAVVYYPSRRFDVFLAGNGVSGGHYNDGVTFSQVEGSLGFTYWFAESARIGAEYTFTVNHTPTQNVGGFNYGDDQQTHDVSLTAGIRLP